MVGGGDTRHSPYKEKDKEKVAKGGGRSCAARPAMMQPLPSGGGASGAAHGGTGSTGSKDEKNKIR